MKLLVDGAFMLEEHANDELNVKVCAQKKCSSCRATKSLEKK